MEEKTPSPTNSEHSQDQDKKEDQVVNTESHHSIEVETKSEFKSEDNIPEDQAGGKFKTMKKPYENIWVPITPQMIILTLNRLQFLRFGPTLAEILINVKCHYPVQPEENLLVDEIKNKLKMAVDCGFVIDHDEHYKLNKRSVKNGRLRKVQINTFWLNYKDRQRQLPEPYAADEDGNRMTNNEFDVFMETDSETDD